MLGLTLIYEALLLMFKQIKIGVLGCADIAQKYVIPSIKNLEDKFELVGVASRTSRKAKEYATKFNTKPYSCYEDLLDSGSLDAVYIPLPNALHYEWVQYALKNKIHVLVEKSLACNLDEVIQLNQLAKKNNVVLIENFQFRFHPQLEFIKNIIKSGEIGELRLLRSSFGFPPFKDKNNIRYQKDLGGGALLDAGAYPIKLSQEILGTELIINSASLYYDDGFNVDTWGSAQLVSVKSKVTSQISFGFDNFYQCKLEVWGSNGIIRTNRIFTAPPSFNVEIEIVTNNGTRIEHVPACNHFDNLLCYFARLINDEEDKNTEYEQNVNQARLVAELLEVSHVK